MGQEKRVKVPALPNRKRKMKQKLRVPEGTLEPPGQSRISRNPAANEGSE